MSNVALLTEIGKPLNIQDCTWSELSYGQVLVKILASGICGAQLQEIDGHKVGGPLPHPLGHEGVGIVEEVGPMVRQVKKRDNVVMHWRKGDGIESNHPELFVATKGQEQIITSGKVTTFSEYSVCSENRLTPVPKDTPVELCALLGCGLSTALGVMENEVNLKIGETVLIIGCGGLGLNLILAAKMRNAGYLAAIDIVQSKEMTAFSMGAHGVGEYAITGRRFDVVVDTTGENNAISLGIASLAPSGRFIMVGQPRGDVILQNAKHMFEGTGQTIKATQGGMFQPTRDIPRYIRAYQAGLLNLNGIISHRLPLSRINEGIQLVRDGLAGRVLIEPHT